MKKYSVYLFFAFIVMFSFISCGIETPRPNNDIYLTIEPANPTIAINQTQQFFVLIHLPNHSVQKVNTSSVLWKSSNTTIATINHIGLATSLLAGSSTITAVLGELNASTQLTVTP